VQANQRRALLRQHQDTGGLAIQPVHQFEEFCLRTRFAHLLDHPKGDPTATVHGDAGRFVDDQHVVIFKKNIEMGGRYRRVSARFASLGNPDGGHAHQIAVLEAVLGVDPALIYTYFPATQDAVNMAFRHPFTDP
jgi:hypothetical protein